MAELRTQLETCWRERVCFVGLGNPAQGDDGAGLRLAEAIRSDISSSVRMTGLYRRGEKPACYMPERWPSTKACIPSWKH